MFKDIKDIEIEYKYCGAFASTKDNLGSYKLLLSK